VVLGALADTLSFKLALIEGQGTLRLKHYIHECAVLNPSATCEEQPCVLERITSQVGFRYELFRSSVGLERSLCVEKHKKLHHLAETPCQTCPSK
jgi:hypothetical protein